MAQSFALTLRNADPVYRANAWRDVPSTPSGRWIDAEAESPWPSPLDSSAWLPESGSLGGSLRPCVHKSLAARRQPSAPIRRFRLPGLPRFAGLSTLARDHPAPEGRKMRSRHHRMSYQLMTQTSACQANDGDRPPAACSLFSARTALTIPDVYLYY